MHAAAPKHRYIALPTRPPNRTTVVRFPFSAS